MASKRAKISPDLVQHIMQYAWELKVAETPAGADGDTNTTSKRKFPVKDEAVVATAEVLRLFAEEITARAAEMRLWTETTETAGEQSGRGTEPKPQKNNPSFCHKKVTPPPPRASRS
jgi:hypothetical protein